MRLQPAFTMALALVVARAGALAGVRALALAGSLVGALAVGYSLFIAPPSHARPADPDRRPRPEQVILNDEQGPMTGNGQPSGVLSLSGAIYQDTVSYGGTWWAPDSMRWEAIRDSCWTFDTGVGSSINTGGIDNKPVGYHQTMEGWYGIDQRIWGPGLFRRSTTCAINGSWSLWSGMTVAETNALCFASGQGYGNAWNSVSSKEFSYPGVGTVGLSFKYVVDAEPGFDHAYVLIDTAASGSWWHQVELAAYDGAVSGTASFTLMRGVTMRSTPGPVRILLISSSDGSYSDEDGLYPTVCGLAAFDDIVLSGAIVDSSDFETSDEGWESAPGYAGPGDFSDIADIGDLPPPATFCPCGVRDSVLVFFNESFGHTYEQDNIAASPWIDLRRGGDLGRPGRLMIYDIYADQPPGNYTFVQIRARFYPDVCAYTGLLRMSEWRDQNVAFFFGSSPFCTAPNLPRLRDYSSVIPQGAEQVQIAYGVIDLCHVTDLMPPCSGITNTAPWLDNISLGIYGTPNAPVVSTLPATRFQDNFASDGTQLLTAPGRIDTNRIKGATTPVAGSVLGDTLTVGCGSSNAEVRLVFRVRPGPFTSTTGLAGRAARWTAEPNLAARYGGAWYSARMDTAEQGGVRTAGTWMSTFHEADPGFQGSDTSIDPTDVGPTGGLFRLANDILPDDLFTAGSRIDYFVAARFMPPDPRNPGGMNWTVNPDTSGGRFREIEILPSSADSNMTWNCTLYVDHHDDREFNEQWIEESGLTMALGAGGHNAEGTRFDRFDVVNPSGGQMSVGRPVGSPYGMSLDQALLFKTVAWHSGSLGTGQLTNEDASILSAWLGGTGVGPNRFWGSGEGLMQSMHATGGAARAFLNNSLGVTQNCTSIRLAACPSGSVIDTTYCLPLAAAPGSDFASTILPRARHNGCPELRSYDVLTVNPGVATARGQLSWLKAGVPVDFASVSNSGASPDFKSVLDGMSVGTLRSNNGYYALGCDDVTAARMRAFDVLSWFDRRLNCPTPTSGVADSVAPGPPGPPGPAPSVWIYSLASARPNPWTPSTRIAFTIGGAGGPGGGGAGGPVRIDLFDVTGRLVRTLVDGPQPTGPGEVTWDGRYADGRLAPQGLYFYQMMAGDGFRAVERLVVVR